MGELQKKGRLLRKVKLNNNGGATVEWMEIYFDPEGGNYIFNSDSRTSDQPVHEDLRRAMAPLAEHLALACEQLPEPKANYAFDGSMKGADKFVCGSVTLRGGVPTTDESGDEPDPVSVHIFGRRRLKAGYVVNFGTYGIKVSAPQEQYRFTAMLDSHLAGIEAEAWAYLAGKHAPPAQAAMDFDAANAEDGSDVKLLPVGEEEDMDEDGEEG